MSVRKNMIRKMRKNIMRMGKITWEGWLNKDDDGTKWPRDQWGYSIHATVNGYKICAPDYNKYEAYKACIECAKFMNKRPEAKELT